MRHNLRFTTAFPISKHHVDAHPTTDSHPIKIDRLGRRDKIATDALICVTTVDVVFPMTRYAFGYALTLIFFVGIDLIWLARVARSTYVAEMGSLLRKDPNVIAAAAFYMLYAAGIVLFAVMPGLKAGSVTQGMAFGAALGLVAYGTYDLTNFAVLSGYSLRITLIDMAWGTVLSGVTAALAVAVVRRVFAE
jgi:uncharacterized membrane protein